MVEKVVIEGQDIILECGCKRPIMGRHVHCPKCNSLPKDHEVRNHSLMWGDGDVHCTLCGTYVRDWDSG